MSKQRQFGALMSLRLFVTEALTESGLRDVPDRPTVSAAILHRTKKLELGRK